MAKIAYLLLCHKAPSDVIRQAQTLTSAGDFVAIHFDKRGRASDFATLRTALDGNANVVFTRRRLRCGWGQWSLVQAALETAQAALTAFPKATHFYLISGDCMPIKSAAYLRKTLDARESDWIESKDFHTSGWIKTGLREERLIYRHLVNERRHKRLFYGLLDLQKTLGLSRTIPSELDMRIGSQWWCLRRRTLEAVVAFSDARPAIRRFFRTSWIPDETFFQTLVPHLVPRHEIEDKAPTFHVFSDYGLPISFYNDQADLLVAQDSFFARKISPEAENLKQRLHSLYGDPQSDFTVTQDGAALHSYLAARGRVGRRFAPRFWQPEDGLGPNRDLRIIAAKKWGVGKRIATEIARHSGQPNLGYVFSEERTPLPDLGGVEHGLDKRRRNDLALLRLLFEATDRDRLILCLDPGDHARVAQWLALGVPLTLLDVTCTYDVPYLQGHARRIGVLTQTTPVATQRLLEHCIRDQISEESETLRNLVPHPLRISQNAPAAENAQALSRFMALPSETAQRIAETNGLFAD